MDIEENTQEEGLEEQVEPDTQLDKKWEYKPGSVLMVLVSVVALGFIIWLIYSVWSLSDQSATLTPDDTEEYVDLTNVPGRDPEVLGLRIDTDLGRMFVKRSSGYTLYVKDGECTGACLDDWVPYLAEEAIEGEEVFGTVLREDTGELQYTWNGNPLYTYALDTENTTLGDGYGGVWQIARP